MKKISIMQGRLSKPVNGKIQSFPKNTWKQEFEKANQAGLKGIEWIFEADDWEKNPISNDDGIYEIIDHQKKTGIIVESICADYFMDIPYLTADNATRKDLNEKLKWLIPQASKIGASFIDIPFVDSSKIENRQQFILVKEFILSATELAQKLNITIALETSLGPEDFRQLLTSINNPMVNANYDTGNSSGIGYNCVEELKIYGEYIKTVHIKDRLLNDGTKPLGYGSANFEAFVIELSKLKYKGTIVLQAAREEEDNEKETAIKNRKFVETYLNKYSL